MGIKIWVGGLENGCDPYQLEDAFKKYGRVDDVWVARRPPGFAFVRACFSALGFCKCLDAKQRKHL